MAIAEENRVYAQIINNKVHWVFDKSKLPEWNEDSFVTVDITDLNPQPKERWSYDGNVFTAPVPDVNGAWERLRERRNILISQSDWSQFNDVQMTMSVETRAAWEKYRKDLRDLPENTSDPFNVVWPKSPLEND